MNRVKFLHCADLHLDMPFSSLGNGRDRSFARRQDLKKVFGKIIGAAAAEKAHLLLLCGDLYEHAYVGKSTISFINDGFRQITDTDVVIVPGNHDPFTVESYYKNFQWNENVHILTPGNPAVFLGEKGVCVYGMGFSTFKEDMPAVYAHRPSDPGIIHILLVHGTLDMHFNKREHYPLSSGELALLDMDYIALGHWHGRMERMGLKGNVYNPGSPEPLGFDEPGDHGFFVCEIEKTAGRASTAVRFVKSNIRHYRELEPDISGCCTDEQAAGKIRAAMREAGTREDIFRIVLRGYVDREYKADLRQIGLLLEDQAFMVKLEDETAPDYDFGEIACEPGLRGLFVRKMLRRIDGAGDERSGKLLRKALYLGMEALERGAVELGAGDDY